MTVTAPRGNAAHRVDSAASPQFSTSAARAVETESFLTAVLSSSGPVSEARLLAEVAQSLPDEERRSLTSSARLMECNEAQLRASQKELSLVSDKVCALENSRGFREKYLGGFFWGDRALVKSLKAQRILQADLERKVGDREEGIQESQKAFELASDPILARKIPSFAAVLAERNSLSRIQGACLEAQDQIEASFSSIRNAKDWEWIDGFGNNLGFSMLSYDASNSAVESAREVSGSLERLKKTIEEERARTFRQDTPTGRDFENFDFLGGITFLSLWRLEELEKIEEWVSQINESTAELTNTVQARLNAAHRILDELREQFKKVLEQSS